MSLMNTFVAGRFREAQILEEVASVLSLFPSSSSSSYSPSTPNSLFALLQQRIVSATALNMNARKVCLAISSSSSIPEASISAFRTWFQGQQGQQQNPIITPMIKTNMPAASKAMVSESAWQHSFCKPELCTQQNSPSNIKLPFGAPSVVLATFLVPQQLVFF
mmetsp:Transcript_19089/g.41797  ORF Transcript_19089/g.41797 Transcript_19089/m.41797 type:complete len:163 (-) Transcript_19089:410-898(-)